ncbi:MAG TPA: alpha/beta hydrolase [Streptosporangiaceae bacterium]|jgi:pimeloyl-ACP methyl ester carboxylesterase|nr:alpha/beta hydrolase [Streptosporangiaceae bacterium]
MPGTVTSGVAGAAGADLYYERRGAGPPLLLITGGGGDSGYYAAAATILADRYTVITYDRRGNSRSTLHGAPADITMAGQSDDAIAVLAANGFGSAAIFGNSGGATIALDLAAHHPQVTDVVVAHEPPVPHVLADPSDYLAQFEEIERVLATEGWQEAFIRFQVNIGLAPSGRPEVLRLLLEPGAFLPSGPHRDMMTRVSGNWAYLMTHEVRPFIDYRPDLGRIVSNRVPIVVACGTRTRDQRAVEISVRTAELLGTECVRFSGGHTAPVDMPRAFAAELAALLSRL